MRLFKREKNHEHAFSETPNQIAMWRKRECPNADVYFEGTLRECKCGALRFKAKHLQEVEVER